MSLLATKGKTFEQPPVGQSIGICYQVIGLGNQRFRDSVNAKVWIGFELPEHQIEVKGEKKPMTIGKEYALYLGGKSKLGDMLKTWRGKAFTPEELEGFDVQTIIGKIGQVAIVERESDPSKRDIQLVLGLIQLQKDALAKGLIPSRPYNMPCVYNPDEHNEAMWKLVPPFLQKKIQERVIETDTPAVAATADFDDGIPF
jgi:hypothetical protein